MSLVRSITSQYGYLPVNYQEKPVPPEHLAEEYRKMTSGWRRSSKLKLFMTREAHRESSFIYGPHCGYDPDNVIIYIEE